MPGRQLPNCAVDTTPSIQLQGMCRSGGHWTICAACMGNSLSHSVPTDCLAAVRIVDANFNRASEGLRVVEEFYRFAADDSFLARQCKELRHELRQLVGAIPAEELSRARQTDRDVGTAISTESERTRQSLAEVVIANWKRVEQSLRAIEEYGKLVPPLDTARVEQLRYQSYTIGKAIAVEQSTTSQLARARLYVLMDGGGAADVFDEGIYRQRVASLVAAGVGLLQLRDKTLDDAALLARAKIVRELTRRGGALLIINDRADLAAAARADGVHLGQEDLPVHEARRIVGGRSLIGVSTHTIDEARQAVREGADYIGCGPIFPSSTKSFDQFAGLDFLRQVAAEITLPAYAIGGITEKNLSQVVHTGMRRVAVSGGVWQEADPAETARRILSQLGGDTPV